MNTSYRSFIPFRDTIHFTRPEKSAQSAPKIRFSPGEKKRVNTSTKNLFKFTITAIFLAISVTLSLFFIFQSWVDKSMVATWYRQTIRNMYGRSRLSTPAGFG
ncbi:MAG: hypothetical protein P8074_07095 [Anaerolineales bacterium]